MIPMKTSKKTATNELEMIDNTLDLTFVSTDGSTEVSSPFKSDSYNARVNDGIRGNVNPATHYKSKIDSYDARVNNGMKAKHLNPSSPSKSILLRKRNDASILRGATRVREEITGNVPNRKIDRGNLMKTKSFDSDEWSNPWGGALLTEAKPTIQNQHQVEPSGSDIPFTFANGFCASSLNDLQAIHSALTIRNENVVGTPKLHRTLSCPSGESSARKSIYQLPSLFDDNDSSEVSHSIFSLKNNLCSPSTFSKPTLCEENVPRATSPTPSRQAPPQSPTPSDDGTHITTMGRGKSLRLKIVTYNVQSLQEMADDATHDDSYESNFEDLSLNPDQSSSSSKEASQSSEKATKIVRLPSLSSPMLKSYHMLQNDIGFCHAQAAGHLWQSLVGQHVRFPKSWFDGLRAPPMGADSPWRYVARLAVHNNPVLNRLVTARSSPGRILLHFLVRDFMTGLAIFDLAIGCFHPNAKGIRNTKRPEPSQENCRHVWMAIRKVTDTASLLDNVICRGSKIKDIARDSPLGNHKREVTNLNMRSIFGELPPVQSICIQESELYEKITSTAEKSPIVAKAPALLLLREFLIVPISL